MVKMSKFYHQKTLFLGLPFFPKNKAKTLQYQKGDFISSKGILRHKVMRLKV